MQLMTTEHLYAANSGSIERAARMLSESKLVVFPTDTVYGVGADAFDETALIALFQVKGRSLEKGIPVLLADREHIDLVARELSPYASELVERFWPGPLTLVVPRRMDLPANLSPNSNIAVRVPDHDVARAIIRAAGGAVATTSANLSGAPAARDAEEALRALQGRVAAVVDAGPAPLGIASTIVDCTVEPPQILRRGALSAEELKVPLV